MPCLNLQKGGRSNDPKDSMQQKYLPEPSVQAQAQGISEGCLVAIRLLICAVVLDDWLDKLHKHIAQLVLPPTIESLQTRNLHHYVLGAKQCNQAQVDARTLSCSLNASLLHRLIQQSCMGVAAWRHMEYALSFSCKPGENRPRRLGFATLKELGT